MKHVYFAFVINVTLVLSIETPTRAQESKPGLGSLLGEQFTGIDRSLRKFDWDAEAKFMTQAINNVFERNEWTAEPHSFARDVAVKVAVIPPWDFPGRLSAITTSVQERYDLTPEAATSFQGAMLREMTGLLMRNATVVIAHGNEMLKTRRMKKPITSEQVARWSKESHDFLEDASKVADKLYEELEPLLPPQSAERLKKDWKAYRTRKDVVDHMVDKWAKGEWDPSHWGLEADPIQNGLQKPPDDPTAASREIAAPPPAESFTESSKTTQDDRPDVTRCFSHDPPTWYVCVKNFIAEYKLNPAQAESARSIHDELVERATDFVKTHSLLTKIPRNQRETHDSFQPIRDLFEQLQTRLNALPTTAQRENAQR